VVCSCEGGAVWRGVSVALGNIVSQTAE